MTAVTKLFPAVKSSGKKTANTLRVTREDERVPGVPLFKGSSTWGAIAQTGLLKYGAQSCQLPLRRNTSKSLQAVAWEYQSNGLCLLVTPGTCWPRQKGGGLGTRDAHCASSLPWNCRSRSPGEEKSNLFHPSEHALSPQNGPGLTSPTALRIIQSHNDDIHIWGSLGGSVR